MENLDNFEYMNKLKVIEGAKPANDSDTNWKKQSTCKSKILHIINCSTFDENPTIDKQMKQTATDKVNTFTRTDISNFIKHVEPCICFQDGKRTYELIMNYKSK